MEISNQQIAKILRNVSAVYTIKGIGNIFQIRAYESAADSIEHSTTEIQDLWEEGKLGEVPALGEKIRGYLDELFRKGSVKHFEALERGIPKIVFDLLDIPGVGPKTAYKIAKLGITSLDGLKKQLKSGELQKKGFSAKLAQNILQGLQELSQRGNRMLLPYAAAQAEKILDYLNESKDILEVHPLGSLRRMVATIGDLDFSASSKNPKKVVEHFCNMPGISRVVDRGDNREARGLKATVVLQTGIQADLLVGEPDSYGALLQHFTGSKNHNIHLRALAEDKGFSLSEYGVKNTKTGKIYPTKTEGKLYRMLNMDAPDPEIREDTGEIEAALRQAQGKPGGLPNLVKLQDIRGDLHLHSNYPIKSPSHGPGADSMEDIISYAQRLGYQYVGISDHPPGFTTTGRKECIIWVKKRTKFIQYFKKRTKSIRVLNGLEIDILGDGSLSVPDQALEALDYCIAGIHSGHRGSKDEITKRLVSALMSPHVDIISHPTNRLLNERESSEVDWEEIFRCAAEKKKLLEINGYPNRLDLRDDLVRQALRFGVKFIINTDAHEVSQMDNMRFGVAVARRGWAQKEDVVNSWDWTRFAKWFKL